MFVHLLVMSNSELKTVVGGGFTATMLNAIARNINSILDLGRSFGSALRRLKDGNLC